MNYHHNKFNLHFNFKNNRKKFQLFKIGLVLWKKTVLVNFKQKKNDFLNKSTREKVICVSVIFVLIKIYKSNLVYSTQDDMSNEKFVGKENEIFL